MGHRTTLPIAAVALCLAWQGLTLYGQARTFEVASVKPNKSGAQGVRIQLQPGGRFIAVNATLRQLVREAYSLQNFQLSGGDGWIATETFDIMARGEGNDVDVLLMLQKLLADRFKLKVRQESREMPVFVLTKARSDGRLGPQMKAAVTECGQNCGISMGPGKISGKGATMSQLARVLPGQGRLVLDRTGLADPYDFDLAYSVEMTAQDLQKADSAGFTVNQGGGSLFSALQEQLGLKLESQRGPVPTVVIESAERPTPD